MGQQHILLIALSSILVGLAIAVGIARMNSGTAQEYRDGITSGLAAIAVDAYQYRCRPLTLGGGSKSYANYAISGRMRTDHYGTYSIHGSPTRTEIRIDGKSSADTSCAATATVDSTGRMSVNYTPGW